MHFYQVNAATGQSAAYGSRSIHGVELAAKHINDAGGFKDTTRLASTDPAMSHDIAVTNREQIVHWLSRFRASVYELEQKLSATEEEEELFRYLAQAQFEHESFINGKIGRAEGEPGMDKSAGFDFGSFLMVDVIRDKLAEVQRNQEERLTDLEKKQRSKRNV